MLCVQCPPGQKDHEVNVNAYHNLAGWLRDVRAVLGDRTELADSYYYQLRDLLEEALDLVGDDVSDSEELEPQDADTDVEVLGPGDGGSPRTERGRTDPREHNAMGRAPGMGDPLPRAREETRRRSRSGAPPVAGAGQRVKRVESIEVPLPLNPPRPASSRSASRGGNKNSSKGRTRGTRKTKR